MKKKIHKILVLGATEMEMKPLLNRYCSGKLRQGSDYSSAEGSFYRLSETDFERKEGCAQFEIDFLITGAGLMSSAFVMGNHFALHRYDFVLQYGIAGCFGNSLKLGDVALVLSDINADEGVERAGEWKNLHDLGIGYSHFESARLECNAAQNEVLFYAGDPFCGMPRVHAVSVNTVSAEIERGEVLRKRHDASIETMEGAAYFYAAKYHKIPLFFALRGISNSVGASRKDWNIPLAIERVNEAADRMLECYIKSIEG